MNPMRQRILGAIDLAIDFATLGEYGLEPLPATAGRTAGGPCRERPGPARRKPSRAAVEAPSATGWETFARARQRGCAAHEAGSGHSPHRAVAERR